MKPFAPAHAGSCAGPQCRWLRIPLAALILLLWTGSGRAQLSTNLQGWMHRINSGEFGGGAARGGGGGGRGARGGGGQWVDGGRGYTRLERGALVRYDTATGSNTVVMSAAQMTPPQLGRAVQPVESGSTDGRHLLFTTGARPTMIRKTAYEYWALDKTNGSWHKLGGKTNSAVLYAKLSPDGTRAAYVRGNNLYVEDVRSGAIKRLTSDGSPGIINGTSDWVNEEEFFLRDGFEWSPDGKNIACFQFDQSQVPEFALINYTDTLYPVITKYHYPKPGQTNAAVRIGVVGASGGRTRWLKVPGEPRDIYIPRLGWAGAGEVILQQLNRLQNTNNVWLADAKSGAVRLLYQDRDDAWVDINERFIWIQRQPGRTPSPPSDGGEGRGEGARDKSRPDALSQMARTPHPDPLPFGRGEGMPADPTTRLLFVSERDGWRHAYAVSRDGEARLITTGAFDLVSVSGVDEAGGWLYYIASPDNATQRYLYRSRLDGSGAPGRVTPSDAPGTHTYSISPDGRWAFHSYSKFDGPGVSDLVSLPDHKVVRVFQDNAGLKAKVAAILTNRTELFQVDVGDGAKLDGWLIRPSAFDPSKKYPLIVNVYGEPAATTVNDSWAGTGRLLLAGLADDGYLVASFDNRGTPSPKGRAWRKVVYGSVGVLSAKEQAAAVRALAATHPYVDLERVGVFGWSGGGSMTLNLMFRSPELYKVGVAGAPVPDQALYDSIYQERFMGLPQQNGDGYKAGSPITYANGLRGKLLIIHGTGDDNVHFQGTQRLINKLIELNKQFSFMEYPNRRHGISGEHLDTLRYGFLEEYLPAGGR